MLDTAPTEPSAEAIEHTRVIQSKMAQGMTLQQAETWVQHQAHVDAERIKHPRVRTLPASVSTIQGEIRAPISTISGH